MRNRLTIYSRLGALLCGALMLAAPVAAATLSGKVTVDAEGVPGVSVAAWPQQTLSFAGEAPYRAQPSDADGLFSLELPAGRYYLLAAGDGLFSYYGRNPVAVPADGLANVSLPLVSREAPDFTGEPLIETGVFGRVTLDGEPVSNAVVFVYPDLSSELKGFGLGMSAPTAADGLFEMPLSAGNYYMVARVRSGGGFAGPLKAGDLFGYAPRNPVAVADGQVARVALPVIEVPEKVSRIAATMFGATRISGRVVDLDGTPVAGIRVLLYADATMLDRPLYVSQPSTADGTFFLSFPAGGTYYLAARDNLGGTPAPGELYGRYRDGGEQALQIEAGQKRDDIEIVVEEVW